MPEWWSAGLTLALTGYAVGIVCTSHGSTEREATEHALAEESDCHDVGPEAAGTVFPDPPRHVATWKFAGYPTAKVLGVRSGEGSFAVFVADSVPREERGRIHEELARAANQPQALMPLTDR